MSLIEEILSEENLTEAIKKVKSNKGASGIDKMPVGQIDEYFMTSRTSRELEEYMGVTHCTVYRRKRKLQQRYKMAAKELDIDF